MVVKGLYIMDQRSFDLVYPEKVRSELEKLADIYAAPLTSMAVKQNYALLEHADVLFTGWGGPQLDTEFLNYAPNLKAVFYAAGSLKNMITEEVWRRNIKITNAVNANAVPVAEFTLSQILFCLKNGWQFVRDIRSDHEYPSKPYTVKGAFQSTVGLISLSTVGRCVCELLKLFDIKVLAYDPFVKEDEAERLGIELCSLTEIFNRSDIVSLHAPLLEETRGMIRGEHLQGMKSNASFINTARGAIVREMEMIEVLKKRRDITAVLDVTFPEPPEKNSPLYTMPNVVLTPHLAGSQGEECGRMGHYMLEEFTRYIKGEPLRWEISEKRFETLA